MIKDFEYFGPKTLKEALVLIDKYQDDYNMANEDLYKSIEQMLEELQK